MDWDPFNIDSGDYAAPPPMPFFHHALDTQLFGDDNSVSSCFSSAGDVSPVAASLSSLTGVQQVINNSSGVSSCDESDFSDLIGDTFSENLLKNEPLSFLSAEEIFSQIDDVCGNGDFQQDISSAESSPRDTPFLPVKEEQSYSTTSSRVQSPVSDPLAIAMEAVFVCDDISSYEVNNSDQTSSGDSSCYLTDQSLDKVELDIAQLKQEVGSTSDEDSLWSDFFSEDDPSEISPEYENLLKSLLSTPVDDINLSLNVFNNVDEESEEQSSDLINGYDRSVLVDYITSDHAYTLPWTEMDEELVVGSLTPPNSSSDSESEMEETDQFCSSPNSDFISSELVPKFMNPRTVKLKHKKDLKFVFSLKVKDENNSELNDLSSLITNNKAVSTLKSTPQLCKKSIYKGVSVLKRNIGSSHHNHSSSLLHNNTYSNSIKRTSSHSPAAVRTITFEDGLESSMSDEALMMPESISRLAVNRAMKMQTDRELHNSMERQRRIQLKSEFDTLKDRIPDLRGNEKVSKLNVLNVASGYVKKLEKVEGKLRQRKHQLREEKRRLIQQLAMLNQT